MKRVLRFANGLVLGTLAILAPALRAQDPAAAVFPTLVVHGGAGTLRRDDMTADKERAYRSALEEGLKIGERILTAGGSSLDAVEAVVRFYEDSPLFNAGRGAVFTAEGRNELDASIMDGATLQAGAVASVTTIRHPVSAARAVMENTPHVLLVGPGAEAFAAAQGLEIVDPSFFFTQERWDALQRAKQPKSEAPNSGQHSGEAKGTVGALALDRQGRLAAATSTGGITNKYFGRVGDTPIVGAGTYATAHCAVSATGTGEFFIRHAVAYDICARAEYLNVSVASAAETVIEQVLAEGIGGVITLDAGGNISMPFNTEGMFRGYIRTNEQPQVAIYRD